MEEPRGRSWSPQKFQRQDLFWEDILILAHAIEGSRPVVVVTVAALIKEQQTAIAQLLDGSSTGRTSLCAYPYSFYCIWTSWFQIKVVSNFKKIII